MGCRYGRTFPMHTQRQEFQIKYDSVGAGTRSLGTSWSYSHTLGNLANAIITHVYYITNNNGALSSLTVKIGSTTIPLLNNLALATSGSFHTYLLSYGLLAPTVGAQTISITASPQGFLAASSAAYLNVSSFGGTYTTNLAASTSLTSGSIPASQAISHAFGIGLTANPALSAYSANQRIYLPDASGTSGGLIIGDALAPTGLTITASASPGDNWGSVAVPLH